MSTIKAEQWLNSDGTENYKCRAWVLFNGTSNTIVGSQNILSYTDRGVGLYSFTMSSPMADASYGVVVSGTASQNFSDVSVTQTTTTFGTRHTNSGGTSDTDCFVAAVVFR